MILALLVKETTIIKRNKVSTLLTFSPTIKVQAKNTQQPQKNLLIESSDEERGINNKFNLNQLDDSFDKKSAYTDFKRGKNKES